MLHSLNCKLISRQGQKAEIEIENQRVLVSLDRVPAGIGDNQNFELYFSDPSKSAKAILEEILNGK